MLSNSLPLYSFIYLKICLFTISMGLWIPVGIYFGVYSVLDTASGCLHIGFSFPLTPAHHFLSTFLLYGTIRSSNFIDP